MAKLLEHPPVRPDYLVIKRRRGDERSIERIREHYLLERKLAAQLLCAPRAQRATVYRQVYSELFTSLPDHPQHTSDPSAAELHAAVTYMNVDLASDATFLEIGCGDAAMCFAVADKVRHAYGLDVTDELIRHDKAPGNFVFLRTKSTNVDLPDDTVDVAYSNQLMEHLHPDDALEQLKEIVRVLKRGGRYSCKTPSKVTGPHDVSEYFDYAATGFHLCEYTYVSIRRLFRRAGFSQIRFYVNTHGVGIPFPYWIARLVEMAMLTFPVLKRAKYLRNLMALNVVATK